MPSDYIPDSFKNRLDFFAKFKRAVHDHAAPLSLNAARLTAIDAGLDHLIESYQAAVDAESALRQANGDATEIFTNGAKTFRDLFTELKVNPGFTVGMGEEMQIYTTPDGRAPADIQPRLTATGHRGGVTLDGSKDYAETVNIYSRRRGETARRQIAIKRKRLLFGDQTPPLQPGVPEEREYLARGVIADEVGKESQIVTATFTP